MSRWKITVSFPEEGTELWRWRIEHNVSRENLADYIGISMQTLSRYEQGEGIKPATAEVIGYATDYFKRHPEDIEQVRASTKIPPMGAYTGCHRRRT